jgi:predicted HTH domain antitoxin
MGVMTTKIHLEMELPEGLVDTALEEELRKSFREETALRLFREGKISSGFAAHLIGIPRVQFLHLLRQRGIPFIQYTAEDYHEDLKAIEQLEQEPKRDIGSR